MKTTIDISDRLPAQAKSYASQSGLSLSEVIEEGLRKVLDTPASGTHCRLTDLSLGTSTGADPLESYSWLELRAMICGDPGTRPSTSQRGWKDFRPGIRTYNQTPAAVSLSRACAKS